MICGALVRVVEILCTLGIPESGVILFGSGINSAQDLDPYNDGHRVA
jgi:hypothetical protein